MHHFVRTPSNTVTMAPKGKWAIAIHGGAGTISKDTDPLPYEKALTYSMGCAARVLECGRHDAPWNGSGLPSPPVALGAALAAVEAMEDCELFNAGKFYAFDHTTHAYTE